MSLGSDLKNIISCEKKEEEKNCRLNSAFFPLHFIPLDPQTQMNPDQTGSGSTPLLFLHT